MLIFEPSFVKVSQRVSGLQTQTVGLTLKWSQFTKGHNSVKTVDGVMVLIFAYCLVMLYIYTKFQENISKDFRSIERMPFVC